MTTTKPTHPAPPFQQANGSGCCLAEEQEKPPALQSEPAAPPDAPKRAAPAYDHREIF